MVNCWELVAHREWEIMPCEWINSETKFSLVEFCFLELFNVYYSHIYSICSFWWHTTVYRSVYVQSIIHNVTVGVMLSTVVVYTFRLCSSKKFAFARVLSPNTLVGFVSNNSDIDFFVLALVATFRCSHQLLKNQKKNLCLDALLLRYSDLLLVSLNSIWSGE